jgi:hypothetical protein
MKKSTILGLTSANKLVAVFDDSKTFVEGKFEGFDITNPLKFRSDLDQIIGKDIDCSFNKN